VIQGMTDEELTSTKDAPEPRISFRIEQVEISWLPVSEASFLLWVLVLLLALWLGIGVALGLV
jgi:hypothetical protein